MTVQSKEEALKVLEKEGIFPNPDEVSFEECGLERYIVFKRKLCTKEEFSWELLTRTRRALKAKWSYFNKDKTIKIELPSKPFKNIVNLMELAEKKGKIAQKAKKGLCLSCIYLLASGTTCEYSGTYLIGNIHGKCSTYKEKGK